LRKKKQQEEGESAPKQNQRAEGKKRKPRRGKGLLSYNWLGKKEKGGGIRLPLF